MAVSTVGPLHRLQFVLATAAEKEISGACDGAVTVERVVLHGRASILRLHQLRAVRQVLLEHGLDLRGERIASVQAELRGLSTHRYIAARSGRQSSSRTVSSPGMTRKTVPCGRMRRMLRSS